jgi:hypothetical protein
MLNNNLYLLFSIFLYIFKVYVVLTHEQQMNLVLVSSVLLLVLTRNRNNNIFSELIENIIIIFVFLGAAYYLPNLIIGYILALIFKNIIIYLNIYYNLSLIV